jgi:hypothetical protein
MIEQVQAFYVPIYKVRIYHWAEKKRKLLGLIDFKNPNLWSQQHFSDYHHNCDAGCSYMLDFTTILEDELNEVVRVMGKGITITDLWAQQYKQSNYMGAHSHGATGYSCVLYAEFDAAEHQATRFIAPFNNFHTGAALEYTPDVEEGDMVIFPSVLLHDAKPNESNKHRTIFSFNCRFVDHA